MRKSSSYLLASMLFSLGLACFVERRIFTDALALNDDVRNQIYWLARITAPQLFQHDYIASYFTQPLLISPVLKGLYSLLALWVNPLVLSQFLPLFLVVLATFFLFRLCEKYRDARYAFWVAYSFNLSIWLIKNLAGGLPRAFIYPLLFALLWALQAKRWRTVAILLWLCALIYPPVFILGLGILVVEVISAKRSGAGWAAQLQCLAGTLVGSLVVIAGRFLSSGGMAHFGPLTNAATAERMRDCYWGGRIVLFTFPYQEHAVTFPLSLIWFVLQRLPHFYILIPLVVFAVLALIYKKYLRQKLGAMLFPPCLWKTVLASCILYILAWLFLFYLYVPERYLEYTLLIIPSFIFGSLVYQIQQRYPAQKNRIACGYIALTLLGTGMFWRSDLMRIPKGEQLLYRYLQQLPVDAMIAAPPSLASNIPLFASRSVLLSDEAYIPFHQAYFYEMKTRLKDWLSAYYAVDAKPVDLLISKYHVDYLIVQLNDFTPDRLKSLPRKSFHAFDKTFYSAIQQTQTQQFYLMHLPPSCFVYRTDSLWVISTKALKQCFHKRVVSEIDSVRESKQASRVP